MSLYSVHKDIGYFIGNLAKRVRQGKYKIQPCDIQVLNMHRIHNVGGVRPQPVIFWENGIYIMWEGLGVIQF